MKIDRKKVYEKYGGRCAYSGTPLEPDWQLEHIIPKKCAYFYKSEIMKKYYSIVGNNVDDIENIVPVQKIINHYKRGLMLDYFRKYWLGGLHKRISKLPKNPKSKRSIGRKVYLLKVASYFGITKDMPFSGIFYFETFKKEIEEKGFHCNEALPL